MADMIESPLSYDEAIELDSFGELCGAQLLGIIPAPARAMELWEREILFGSPAMSHCKGLLTPGGASKV